MTPRRRGAAAAGFAVVWAGLLFWESSRANPFPFVPEGILSHDKLLHACAYAVLGGLVAAALAATTRLRAGRVLALAVLVAAAYGATDEWHQYYVPGRDCDPLDWAADAAGAAAGAAAALALRGRTARASIRAHADDPPV